MLKPRLVGRVLDIVFTSARGLCYKIYYQFKNNSE